MSKFAYCVALLACVAVCVSPIQAADKPAVNVSTTVAKTAGAFSYSYTVTNTRTSKVPIDSVAVDIASEQRDTTLQTALPNGDCVLANITQVVLATPRAQSFVRVGQNAPSDWLCSVAANGTATWDAAQETAQIFPGQQRTGFVLLSTGLPGIRVLTAAPPFDVSETSIVPPVDDTDLKRYLHDLDDAERLITATVMTVGPEIIPTTISDAAFLDRLQAIKVEADRQHWIIDRELSIKLGRLLERGSIAVQKAKGEDLRDALREVIQITKDDDNRAEKLTTEAKALFRFNAEYLLERTVGTPGSDAE